MKGSIIKSLGALITLYVFSFAFVWQVRDFTYLFLYDILNENHAVDRKEDIDRILATFELIHLKAIGMIILDVNKDGKYTDEDKQIVIDLLERKIIKNEGGIGKYPGTRTVHMDVRGYRARWDSY